MVQSNRPHPSPAPDLETGGQLFRSLEDRLVFRQAQGLLAGLTGCGRPRAAQALRATAERLDADVPDVARRFRDGVEHPGDESARELLLQVALATCLRPGRASGRSSVVPGPGRVTVRGGLTLASAPLLLPAFGAAAAARPWSAGGAFVLDLADLTDLDSAGVHALDTLANRARDGGPAVAVVPPSSPGLARVLDFAVSLRWLLPAFGSTSCRGSGHDDRAGVRTTPEGLPPLPEDAPHLEALEALYGRHASPCWSLARRLLGDDAEADVVVLTIFVEAYHQLAREAAIPRPTGPELLQRTHREAVRRLREVRAGAGPAPAGHATADLTVARGGRQRSSRRGGAADPGLAGLPHGEAHALRLAYWSGLTLQQIAVTTGTPLAGVRANVLAGVRSLSRGSADEPQQRATDESAVPERTVPAARRGYSGPGPDR